MIKLKEDKQFEQLVHQIVPQAKWLRTWNLAGGFSSQMTAFEMVLPNGKTKKMVKRSWQDDPLESIRSDLYVANEFKLLQLLYSSGLAVPEPYYLDQSSQFFSSPYMVSEYVEGKSEVTPSNLADYLLQFATLLAKIHQFKASTFDLSFLPQQTEVVTRVLRRESTRFEDSFSHTHIRKTLQAAGPIPQHNESVLLHGDLHPGNLLWQHGQLAAVVDWEFAALGDPLSDLAASRLEILWAFDSEAMHRFTAQYTSIMDTLDLSNLPYWELYAGLFRSFHSAPGWFDNELPEVIQEKHRWFTTQALEKLSV